MAEECACAKTYATYEGPEVACPVHGAVVALNEVMRERDLLLWLHAEAVWKREESEASRQAWAEEAMRLHEVLIRLSNDLGEAGLDHLAVAAASHLSSSVLPDGEAQ